MKSQDLAEVPERKRKVASKARTKVNPISARRRTEMKLYKEVRVDFLMAHRWCEVGPTLRDEQDWECLGGATQVHHVVNRSQARALITDVRNFCAVCSACHDEITTGPKWARRDFWSFSSLRLPDYIALGQFLPDGRALVALDSMEPMAVATGELVLPELFVLAYAARIVDETSDPHSVGPRNGKPDDARLCNLKLMDAA